VRLHRKPPRALALRTSMKPDRTKCVSVATIRRTPQRISAITPTRRREKVSSLNRNAKKRTKMSEEDLHIAKLESIDVIIEINDGSMETHCKRRA
jgi:hypothetical protein